MGLEEEHQIPQLRLRRKRLHDHRQLLLSDPLDLQQMPRLPFENIECLQAEPGHHASRHGRSDPLHSPGAEETFDGRQRCGEDTAHPFTAELASILRMNRPRAGYFDLFAWQRRSHASRHHHHPLLCFQPEHDIFVLPLKSYIFDHSGQCIHRNVYLRFLRLLL